MAETVIMDHPLIKHKIGIARRTDTGSMDFRNLISEVAGLMCYEATRNRILRLKHLFVRQQCRSLRVRSLR